MADQSRDVSLNLRVNTIDGGGITTLEQQVRDLAAEGGAAAPAFEKLADEVSRLGQNAAALNGVAVLADEVKQLEDAADRTGTTALTLAQDLERLNAVTVDAMQTEASLAIDLDNARAALQASKDALAQKRAETEHSQRATEEYRTVMRQLKDDELQAAQAVRSAADAYRAAAEETALAVAEEKGAATALDAATAAADRSARALQERNQALQEARTALLEMGVATTDVTAESDALATRLSEIRTEADELAASQRALAEGLQLTQAGFDMQAQRAEEAAAKEAAADKARAEAGAQALQRLRAEQAATARSAQELSEAFGTIKMRGLAEIEAEIARVREAMAVLKESGTVTGGELNRAMSLGAKSISALEVEARKATGSMSLMQQVTDKYNSVFGHFGEQMAAYAALGIGAKMATDFVEANVALQKLELGFNQLYKSTDVANKQIDFLRQVANSAGVSVGDISGEFLRYSASMHASNISMQESNELFRAVAQAAGTLGLSGQQVSEMLNALGQMAAKGTVSMQELKLQLGNALPGALALTAQGLGVTETQLMKMVESGTLASRDLFPALTTALKTMGGEVNTLGASWARFKNVLTETAQVAGEGGGLDALSGGLKVLGLVVASVVIPLQGFFEVLFGTVKILATGAAAIMTWTSPLKAWGEIVTDAGNRLSKTEGLFDSFLGTGEKVVESQGKMVESTAKVGQAHAAAAPQIAAGTAATVAHGAAAAGAATAVTSFGTAEEQAAAKTALAKTSIIQLTGAFATHSAELAHNVVVATNLAHAQDVQAKSLDAVAKLTGSQTQQLELAVQAAEGQLNAQQRILAAREAEITSMKTYLLQMQEDIKMRGDPDGSRQKMLDDQRQHLTQLEAEAQRTHEKVEEEKTAVEQAKVNQQSYEDNAKSVGQFKAALEAATQARKELEILEINGKATQDQVTDAFRREAAAAAMYRDALGDVAKAAGRASDAAANKNLVTQATLKLQDIESKNLAALGKSLGDNTLQLQAQLDQKENEIKRRLANADAMTAEVAKMRADAEAMRQSAIVQGDWNASKQDAYDKLMASARAKEIDAQGTRESTDELHQEIQRLLEDTDARNGNTDSINRNTDALSRNNSTRNQPTPMTDDGFKANKDGSAAGTFSNSLPVDQAWKLAYGAGGPASPQKSQMTMAEAQAAMKQAQDYYDDMQAVSKLDPGSSSYAYETSATQLYTMAKLAFERVQAENGAGTLKGSGGSASATTAAGSTSHTVTINLGGTSKTVNMTSAQDASSLTSLLQQLETSSKSAV